MSVPFQGGQVTISGVENAEQNAHAERDPIKHSHFLITVNTNQSFSKKDVGHVAQRMKMLILEFLSEDVLPTYVQFHIPGDTWNPNTIMGVETAGTVERGGKYGQLHAHIIVSIDHVSSIHLNRVAIADFFAEELGLENVHVRISAHPHRDTAVESMKKYIYKNNTNNGAEED